MAKNTNGQQGFDLNPWAKCICCLPITPEGLQGKPGSMILRQNTNRHLTPGTFGSLHRWSSLTGLRLDLLLPVIVAALCTHKDVECSCMWVSLSGGSDHLMMALDGSLQRIHAYVNCTDLCDNDEYMGRISLKIDYFVRCEAVIAGTDELIPSLMLTIEESYTGLLHQAWVLNRLPWPDLAYCLNIHWKTTLSHQHILGKGITD